VITIGFAQINNSFSGQNYLPYSTACLEGYLRDHSKKRQELIFLDHVYKRAPINQIVSAMESADIVGISTYVWNIQISLEVSRRIKERWPDKLIVFGGPQVPDKPEEFLRSNRFVDLVVHNEGERTFTAVVDSFPTRNWENITGVSYLSKQDEFRSSPPTPRMRELNEVPSPFLNGIFDGLLERNPAEKWIGLWETNRGCPFQCTFCDWGSATAAKVTKFEEDRVLREIDWMARNKIEYIFVCDANFGIQTRDIDIAKRVAEIKEKTGYPQGFSVQNTKNATERAYETQKIIADAGLNKGVALSMQSLDPVTLQNIKRDNISLETYLELARRFTADNIETYSDLILPLPGETYESFCAGVDSLINAGQHNRIQFNNLSILPNAEMGDPEYLKKFGMVTKKSEIINIHGSRVQLDDDVPEFQELVVATSTMSAQKWIKARTYAWMASFLHFDKLFQIPITVALKSSSVTFTNIIEAFMNASQENYPIINSISRFFAEEATKIQNGGVEYVYSSKWLEIYWPADEYIFIKLTVDREISNFYREAEELILDVVNAHGLAAEETALKDAVKANEAMLSQPFVSDAITVSLSYDVIDFWNSVRAGGSVDLEKKPIDVIVDRSSRVYQELDDWCREVVWWGNKKGAYLYGVESVSQQLAGHF
jgi:radical SAM superfamily enzyme YgiQ (UPF0313 family)